MIEYKDILQNNISKSQYNEFCEKLKDITSMMQLDKADENYGSSIINSRNACKSFMNELMILLKDSFVIDKESYLKIVDNLPKDIPKIKVKYPLNDIMDFKSAISNMGLYKFEISDSGILSKQAMGLTIPERLYYSPLIDMKEFLPQIELFFENKLSEDEFKKRLFTYFVVKSKDANGLSNKFNEIFTLHFNRGINKSATIPKEYMYAINVARNNTIKTFGRDFEIFIRDVPDDMRGIASTLNKTHIEDGIAPIILNTRMIKDNIEKFNLNQKELNAFFTVIIGHEARHSGSSLYITNALKNISQSELINDNVKRFFLASASQMEEITCDMGGVKALFNSIGKEDFNENVKKTIFHLLHSEKHKSIPFSDRTHPLAQSRLSTMDTLYSLYTTKKNICNAMMKSRNIVTLDTPGKRFKVGASVATMAGAGMAAMAAANESYDYNLLLESKVYSNDELLDIISRIHYMLIYNYDKKINELKSLNIKDLITFENHIIMDSKRIITECKNNITNNDVLCYMLSLGQLFVAREDYINEYEKERKFPTYSSICRNESNVLENNLIEFYKNVKDQIKDIKKQITDQKLLDKIEKVDSLNVGIDSSSILRSLTNPNNIKILLTIGVGSVVIYYVIKYWKRIKEKVSSYFNKEEN